MNVTNKENINLKKSKSKPKAIFQNQKKNKISKKNTFFFIKTKCNIQQERNVIKKSQSMQ